MSLVNVAADAVVGALARYGSGGHSESLPNHFLVRVSPKTARRHGMDGLLETYVSAISDQIPLRRVSPQFFVTVESTGGLLSHGPTVTASALSGTDLAETLRTDRSRAETGLAVMAAYPASRMVIRTCQGRTMSLKEPTTFGSGQDSDVRLPVRGLSRRHCEVCPETDGGWRLVDLGSTNGTMLNGNPVRNSPINEGDDVSIADSLLFSVIEVEDSIASAIGDVQPSTGRQDDRPAGGSNHDGKTVFMPRGI